jgi:glycine/D-amino acid oxidase-like deaminating enzyme
MLEYDYDVVIVGAGVAGASAAYHLTTTMQQQQETSSETAGDHATSSQQQQQLRILVVDAGSNAGEGTNTRHSGSAVMNGETAAATIKMMTQVFATSSATFITHHGMAGVDRYLRATAQGLIWQKAMAKVVLDDPSSQLRELGSFYLGYPDDRTELRAEYELLQALPCCSDIEWYDKEQLQTVAGCPPNVFDCGIYFPRDAIIDSSSYAKGLLRYCQSAGTTAVLYDATVSSIVHTSNTGTSIGATVHLSASGSPKQLTCRHVVVATGGLWQVPELNGILRPCYSYLVHVPLSADSPCGNVETSSNFFTWGYSHDWCFAKGKVRNSGEDHFSAYKDPQTTERCGNLIRWTLDKYQCAGQLDSHDDDNENDNIVQQHGVYSETPDYVPIVGSIQRKGGDGDESDNNEATVCYLLGCNAFGQAVLSYTSALVPGLLGYRPLTDDEKDIMELFTVQRFTHLPGN